MNMASSLNNTNDPNAKVVGKHDGGISNGHVSQDTRYNMVMAAVRFLTHPTIIKTSRETKIKFLKEKGLTDDEIGKAFEQVEIMNLQNSEMSQFPVIQPLTVSTMDARLYRLRNFLNTIATLGGVFYGVYWLYKKYVEPYFFVQKKEKTFEESISEMCISMRDSLLSLQSVVQKLQADVGIVREKQLENDYYLVSDIRSIKSEIATLKGLLLSRNEFPALVSSEPLIPEWQLTNGSATKEEKEKVADNSEKCTNGEMQHKGNDESDNEEDDTCSH